MSTEKTSKKEQEKNKRGIKICFWNIAGVINKYKETRGNIWKNLKL